MKIAIHRRDGSFSDRWIEYCGSAGIPFKIVDCLASSIIDDVRDCAVVLWHWSHLDAGEKRIATAVIRSLEEAGKTVFPNTDTCWHFDDKVAQKYLLEGAGVPLIPTWVHFDYNKAMEWIHSTTWPKVFKLSCGAGSGNVRLLKNSAAAERLCRTMFGKGLSSVPSYFDGAVYRAKRARNLGVLWDRIKRAPQIARQLAKNRRDMPREKGYIYFQEFMPGNTHDTRVTVINGHAFSFLRYNRPGDFRASGSGRIDYAPEKIDKRCITIAFEVAERLRTQSLAFDFVNDATGSPRIAEISYCYSAPAVHACPGCWGRDGTWLPGNRWPQDLILESVVAAAKARLSS